MSLLIYIQLQTSQAPSPSTITDNSEYSGAGRTFSVSLLHITQVQRIQELVYLLLFLKSIYDSCAQLCHFPPLFTILLTFFPLLFCVVGFNLHHDHESLTALSLVVMPRRADIAEYVKPHMHRIQQGSFKLQAVLGLRLDEAAPYPPIPPVIPDMAALSISINRGSIESQYDTASPAVPQQSPGSANPQLLPSETWDPSYWSFPVDPAIGVISPSKPVQPCGGHPVSLMISRPGTSSFLPNRSHSRAPWSAPHRYNASLALGQRLPYHTFSSTWASPRSAR